MVKLVHEARPKGKSTDYRFLRNEETGRRFKVKHELRTASDGSPALAVSISAIDAQHKATRDGLGEPDISHLTHTLTKVELQDPDFDVEARLAAMLASAVEAKEYELVARKAVTALSARWASAEPFDLSKRP